MQLPLETPLLERTRALLAALPEGVRYSDIATATGLKKPWLSKFAAGKIPNPGVHHVQALHDYLAGLQA